MEEPIAEPEAATSNADNVKTESTLETTTEDIACESDSVQICSRRSSDEKPDEIAGENEIVKPAAPLIVIEGKDFLPGAESRDSPGECLGDHDPPTKTEEQEELEAQGCQAENFAEQVSVKCIKRTIECSKCHVLESLFWRTTTSGDLICVECQAASELETKEDGDEELSQAGSDPPTTPSGSDHNEEAEDLADQDDAAPKAPSPRKRELRKATRLKTAKYVKSATKNRRSLTFKKSAPMKTTPAVSHFITSNYIRHKGSYLQRGDVVSMLGDDSEIYYAQLRTFLVDQFGQTSATISWLIPTERSPSDGSFDPATFVLGPEEDFPRDLRSMSFECHAPSDYYLARDKPILFDERKGCKAFVWTALGKPKPIRDSPDAQ
ncbi:GATA zinc finger domain-containing protein 1 [Galendromus occidentalis]|uniref:GATA zinc finger domain-containing protein 1 n=1 Tax=Galendromus occidentalis TaxID=34638 RepID=A0AAJ6QVD0_9ACAR|nr:GATA zinc finger domain-containing protein 1 [Galendromus occidentalis]